MADREPTIDETLVADFKAMYKYSLICKKKIKETELEIQRIDAQMENIHSTSIKPVVAGKVDNEYGYDRDSKLLTCIAKKDKLKTLIYAYECPIKQVDEILDLVWDDDRKLIELIYGGKKTSEQLSVELGLSRRALMLQLSRSITDAFRAWQEQAVDIDDYD